MKPAPPYKLCFSYPEWEQFAVEQVTLALATDFPIIAIDYESERWYVSPQEMAALVMDAADVYAAMGSPSACEIELQFSQAHRYTGDFALISYC